MAVTFIDTSVLCNVVPVPGRDQDSTQVRGELAARMAAGEKFILPITAVIETGNFIAQIPSGGQRRATAEQFGAILDLVRESKAPWILHDVPWDSSFLERLLEGAGTGSDYVEHAVAQVGAGDLCILTERETYSARTGLAAGIWSLDSGLAAHA